jgi:hypothetical protein
MKKIELKTGVAEMTTIFNKFGIIILAIILVLLTTATAYTQSAPDVLDIPDQTINEGSTFTKINLDSYVTDDSAVSQIIWTSSGNTDLTIEITDREATITIPDSDWYGDETITFTAKDVDLLTDSDDAVFTVDNLNDRPDISDIPDQTINEGEDFDTIYLDNYVTDVDQDITTLAWSSSGETDLTVDITNRIATISMPDSNWSGSEIITFRATDDSLEYDEDAATFTVNEINDAPVVSGIPDQTINEGEDFDTIYLDDYVIDVDHEDSTIDWTHTGDYELNVKIKKRVATITTPTTDWSGVDTVIFTATDDSSATDSDTAIFTVDEINDPPVVTIANLSIEEDSSFETIELDTVVTDESDDSLIVWSVVDSLVNDFKVRINSTNRTAEIIPPDTNLSTGSRSAVFTFVAKDPGDSIGTNTATFEVDYTNDPPVLVAVDTTLTDAQDSIRLYLDDMVDDPDADHNDTDMTWSADWAVTDTFGVKISHLNDPSNRYVDITVEKTGVDSNWTLDIEFEVEDPGNSSDIDISTITKSWINDPPFWNELADHPPWSFIIWEGCSFGTLEFFSGDTGYASDVEGHYTLEYSFDVDDKDQLEIDKINDSVFDTEIENQFSDRAFSVQFNLRAKDSKGKTTPDPLPLTFTQIGVTADDLDFGNVLFKSTETIEFMIENPGVDQIAAPEFALTNEDEITLDRAGRASLNSPINGNTEARYYAMWTPLDTNSNPDTISITSDSVSTNCYPVLTMSGDVKYLILSPNEESFDFGYVNSLDQRLAKSETLIVTANANMSGIFDSAWLNNGSSFEIYEQPDADESIDNGSPFEIVLKTNVELDEEFNDQLHIEYTLESDGKQKTYSLKDIELIAEGDEPECNSLDDSIYFGREIIDSSSIEYMRINNPSMVDTYIDSITFPNFGDVFYPEETITWPFLIPADTDTNLPIIFKPSYGQRYEDIAEVWLMNSIFDPDPPRVIGIGSRVKWSSDNMIELGNVQLCDSQEVITFRIENRTDDAAIILSFEIDDTTWFDFGPSYNNPTGDTIENDGIIEISDVWFEPIDKDAPDPGDIFKISMSYSKSDGTDTEEYDCEYVRARGCAGGYESNGFLNFNSTVQLSDSIYDTLFIDNEGECDLTIESLDIDPPFSIVDYNTPAVIPGGSSDFIEIKYKPSSIDDETTVGDLTIRHDGYPSSGYSYETYCTNGSVETIAVTATWIDTIPPELDSIEPMTGSLNRQNYIYVSDIGGGVDTVTAIWRRGNEKINLEGIEPNNPPYLTGEIWILEITESELSDDELKSLGYEVKFTLIDQKENPYTTNWISVSGQYGKGYHSIESSDWLDGSGNDQLWHLISIPGDAENKSRNNIFSNLVESGQSNGGAYDDWRILRVENEDELLQMSSSNAQILPGIGYFFRHFNLDFTVDLPSGITIPTDTPFTIDLNPGWNLISNPFFFDIYIKANDFPSNVSSLIHTDPTSPGDTFTYDVVIDSSSGSGWMEPWVGYAIKNHSSQTRTISLDPHAGPTQYSGLARIGLQLTLNLIIDNKTSGHLTIGTNSTAADGPDINDVAEFDLFGKNEGIFSENVLSQDLYLRDIRPPSTLNSWDLHFNVRPSDQMSLTWDSPIELEDEMALVLRDAVMNSKIDMKATNKYSIPNPNQLPDGRFIIYYGHKSEVDDKFSVPVVTKPERFGIYQNYPNPFNPSTEIAFDVPRTSKVRIEIFNILGKKVTTLLDEDKSAGSHRVIWYGEDDQHQVVAAGIYFARMRVEDYSSTIKLLFVK